MSRSLKDITSPFMADVALSFAVTSMSTSTS